MIRVAAFQKYYYTADLFDWTADAQGNRTYFAAGSIVLDIQGDPSAGARIFTTDPLQPAQRLSNVRDRLGQLVHPTPNPDDSTGVTWEVSTSVPVMSIYGTREFFQTRARVL